jgi:CDP-paratose 2-epimerase
VKLLVTGICGFAGSRIVEGLLARLSNLEIIGIDNLSRRGSELNLAKMRSLGCRIVHGDLRLAGDIDELPRMDWVLDCAAIPTVLAGLTGGTAQLVANNLTGTLNLLEKCRRDQTGLIILSSSRVYSIPALRALPLRPTEDRLVVDITAPLPEGFSEQGIGEAFSTAPPVSLYGATKLASEVMALEYGLTFGFPVRINRCGVIAGPGQFGRIDQGVFSYWVYRWMQGAPLAYIGFGGAGLQVRDFLSPSDLTELLALQLVAPTRDVPAVLNAGGGLERAYSLRQLSDFCERALGKGCHVGAVPETRPFDIPYYVTDNSAVALHWNWRPSEPAQTTLESIVRWAHDHKDQLKSFES